MYFHSPALLRFLALSSLLAAGSVASARPWTDMLGRVIEAEFVSSDAATGKVKLRLANGNEPLIDLAKLSATDRTWITDHLRAEEEANVALKKNAGKTVSLKSEGTDAVGYHIYYPTSFDPSKPPAMIIMFSPGGDGKGILGSVRAACEELGWIGVGCDQFKNGADEAALDKKWAEVLPAIEKSALHDPDLLYLGGMSGGALRAYDYAETTVRPWKGILAFGGWLAGKEGLGTPDKMVIARVNGDNDKNANAWKEKEDSVFKRAKAELKDFTFPGGHVVAPPDVVKEAMRWLKQSTVTGNRLSNGKRHEMPLDK
jgi:predicted esterase